MLYCNVIFKHALLVLRIDHLQHAIESNGLMYSVHFHFAQVEVCTIEWGERKLLGIIVGFVFFFYEFDAKAI